MEVMLCLDSDVESEKQLHHVTDNDPEATHSSDNKGDMSTKKRKRKRNISKYNTAESKAYQCINNKKVYLNVQLGHHVNVFINVKLSDEEKLLVLKTFNLFNNKEKLDTCVV